MNPRLEALHAYPFERLARLKAGITPPAQLAPIAMSIGEPQHTPPAFLLEGLCAFVQAAVDGARAPLIAMPNPFYQIYEGAALLAGARPFLLDTTDANDYLPDLAAVPAAVWRRCQVLFLCTPGNPTGAVLPLSLLQQALSLADRYDFLIASDECYADVYLDERDPPPGLLQAAQAAGRARFERCVVFHSLSKRSSVPGLRSGFVAGDPAIMARLLLYRTYHGSAMPVPTQLASVVAWQDDAHAAANRRIYQEKFARVLPLLTPLLNVARPAGAFYLWPHVGGDDERFTRELFARANLTVLPGSYLGRTGAAGNPGAGRVRISLVPEVAQCVEAAQRLREFLQAHWPATDA